MIAESLHSKNNLPETAGIIRHMNYPKKAELLERINQGEGELTEFKSATPNRANLRRTIVAFANSVGEDEVGALFLGVNDKGKILGVQSLDSLQKKITETCSRDCYPPIKHKFKIVTENRANILVVMVPYSTERPHFAGAAYVRSGSQSVAASKDQYDSLIASRNDICRKIQSWGGQVITIELLGKKLGSPRKLGSDYRGRCECQIQKCDAHSVVLRRIDSGEICSEPLENVLPDVDTSRRRPKLIVRYPR